MRAEGPSLLEQGDCLACSGPRLPRDRTSRIVTGFENIRCSTNTSYTWNPNFCNILAVENRCIAISLRRPFSALSTPRQLSTNSGPPSFTLQISRSTRVNLVFSTLSRSARYPLLYRRRGKRTVVHSLRLVLRCSGLFSTVQATLRLLPLSRLYIDSSQHQNSLDC
jgi:hypothetical protein